MELVIIALIAVEVVIVSNLDRGAMNDCANRTLKRHCFEKDRSYGK